MTVEYEMNTGPEKQNKFLKVLSKLVLFVVRYFVTIFSANFVISTDKEKLNKIITDTYEFIIKHWVRILIICIGTPIMVTTASIVFLMIFG